MLSALALLLQPAPPAPITFAEVVAAAAADARALPPGLAPLTRYLSAAHLAEADRRELFAVMAYHVNGLSREARIVAPRQVTPWLWAVRLDDYRWDAKVWEDLRRVNHYFAARVQTPAPAKRTVRKTRQVLATDPYGRQVYQTQEYTEELADPAPKAAADHIPAPWLPAAGMTALVTLTGSQTPIVRADEFLHQTGIQADRAGHGYYDWLALKSQKDAEALAALDRRKAEELYRELAAIVPVSGVGLNNRQVFRYATLTGSWWETRDPKTNADRSNAVSNLLNDFKADALEIVFTLPNGLPGYYLADDKGVQQDAAPDTIAADHRSTNNDRRVHVGMSCVTCHADGGLKPIRDYARKIYNSATGLALGALALDPATARRLESVYLGPLDRAYKRDLADFGEAIRTASGLAPADMAKAYERQWSRYLDEPVTLARAAAEAGTTPEKVRQALRAHAKAKGVVDPVLAVYLLADEDQVPVRREHFEEHFPVLMLILGGLNP